MSSRMTLCATAVLAALLLCTQASGLTITGASFEVDFAELVAHRFVFGFPVNELIFLGSSGGTQDVSDAFFGTADVDPIINGVPNINQPAGSGLTGIFSIPIPATLLPDLVSGGLHVSMTATDTDDGLFAIDYAALTVQTTAGELKIFIDKNDGFDNGFGIPGIPVSDGGLLPGPLPIVLPGGGNGTGFDEAISSKNIQASFVVPEPATLFLVATGLVWVIAFGRRRTSPSSRELTPDYGSRRLP